ncbi:MAG TPA: tetratricopeptide repeat protein [Bacteroidia bacterium]|jgi:serine phosphatase RsbU (regulator of sigma subunit)
MPRRIALIPVLVFFAFTLRATEPDTGISRLKPLVEEHLKKGDKKSAVGDYLELSRAYLRMGNSRDAMASLFSALSLTENSGDKKESARCLYKIAVLYDRQDDPANAIVYAAKGLKVATEVNDPALIASCLHRMGLAYTTQKKYNEAINVLNRSLDIRKKLDLKSGIAACMNALGLINLEKKEFDKAAFNMTSAYKLWKEVDDKEGMAIATGNLSSLFYTTEDYKQAIHYGMMSYEQARSIGSYVFMKEACLTLSNVYERLEDYKHAHEFYRKYSEIKDTLINEESNQKIALIQSQFESDKQDAKIASLEKQQEQEYRIRNMLVGGIVLIALLVLLVLNRYRLKQKANRLLEDANREISLSRDEIAVQKQEITDSIRYARKLQEALLPSSRHMKQLLPESFVLYKPKDIVSGDFYWVEQWGHQTLVAAVDCTGHGVPGAFMSILGYSLLNRAVNELGLSKPSLILNEMNKSVSRLLRQNKEEAGMKDGMDMALVSIDKNNLKLEFAGAFNGLYLFRNGELKKTNADKFPVGGFIDEELRLFTNHEMELQKGDMIYIFTDGYADQFGGAKGKKFKYKQMQELLHSIHLKPMEEQKEILDSTINEWKGPLEQVDDILVIGIRI